MPKPPEAILAVDTETTGVDCYHGAKPFIVTTCDGAGELRVWEWPVDPRTREPAIPEEDRRGIRQLLARQDTLVLQNPKFDAAALLAGGVLDWAPLWPITFDILCAGHLLASNHKHDLTSMAVEYIATDIQPFEDRLEESCKDCRKLVKSNPEFFEGWTIAEEGLPNMPSVKGNTKRDEEKPWKNDAWLPRAVAVFLENTDDALPEDHPWWTVAVEYANADSWATVEIFKVQREIIKQRGHWKLYLESLRLIRVIAEMEQNGATVSGERQDRLLAEYKSKVGEFSQACLDFAESRGSSLSSPRVPRPTARSARSASTCWTCPAFTNPRPRPPSPPWARTPARSGR